MSTDVSHSLPKRQASRPAHLQRLQVLQEQGRLILAGPHPVIDTDTLGEKGVSGSLIVAKFNNLDEAQCWASNDPYAKSGVYSQIIVKPFKQVFPK